ncbi:Zinc-regulated transporter 2 [Galdieria sulphuraria]|nr:Zinc-regulated transporter 2 [Galdieria sulphuraria]
MSSCYSTQTFNYNEAAHIGALFTILFTSFAGTSLPVVAKRYPSLRIPSFALDAGRAFGTGVVIATGFVHMLPPAITNLSNQCLPYFFTNTYNSLGAAVALAAALSIQLLEMSSTVILNRMISKRNIQQPTDNCEIPSNLQSLSTDKHQVIN